jgi:hypothetical protein
MNDACLSLQCNYRAKHLRCYTYLVQVVPLCCWYPSWIHYVLPLKKTVYPSWLPSAVLWLGACSRFKRQVLPVLFVTALLVVVMSLLGLVRSVILCPLMIFVIKSLSFSVVVSFLLFEYFWAWSGLFLKYLGSLEAYCNVLCESWGWQVLSELCNMYQFVNGIVWTDKSGICSLHCTVVKSCVARRFGCVSYGKKLTVAFPRHVKRAWWATFLLL